MLGQRVLRADGKEDVSERGEPSSQPSIVGEASIASLCWQAHAALWVNGRLCSQAAMAPLSDCALIYPTCLGCLGWWVLSQACPLLREDSFLRAVGERIKLRTGRNLIVERKSATGRHPQTCV